ncbi:MAG: hypothetical protein KJ630_07745 [Proteobacteria bacterium]|nr:hypothetical protein [Pseudomonadota bacterium]
MKKQLQITIIVHAATRGCGLFLFLLAFAGFGACSKTDRIFPTKPTRHPRYPAAGTAFSG